MLLLVALAALSVTPNTPALAHLGQQVDERGEASLEVLVAAAELEPDGLERDRGEHMLSSATGGEPTLWALIASQGQTVAGRRSTLDGWRDAQLRGRGTLT